MKGFTGPLNDRLLIRERMGMYSDATFQADCAAWLASWTDDCVWIVMGTPHHGKAALAAQWERTWSWLERMMFFTEIGAIHVEGDSARARCYCREILHYRNGSTQKVVGMYEDELVRLDGDWLFARRDYHLISDEGRQPPRQGGASPSTERG